jgi:hypothetical protein
VAVLSNERGSIFVQTLVAMVIITIAIFAIFYSDLVFKKASFRKTQGEAAMNILTQKMSRISQTNFLVLAEYCRTKNFVGFTRKAQLSCLTDDRKIRIAASQNEFDLALDLETPLDEAGQVTGDPAKAKSCVEVILCEPKGGGHLLEVIVAQSYFVPALGRVETRSRLFRRTRW